MRRDSTISRELLNEFRVILRENYGLEPPEEEAEEMANNLLRYYRQVERLSNLFS